LRLETKGYRVATFEAGNRTMPVPQKFRRLSDPVGSLITQRLFWPLSSATRIE
jgi:hypothetical protein